jgi:hypothetical protein
MENKQEKKCEVELLLAPFGRCRLPLLAETVSAEPMFPLSSSLFFFFFFFLFLFFSLATFQL